MAKKIESPGFATIRLPELLIDEIKKIVNERVVPHNTPTSFVEYAVRKHLEKTKKDIILERQHQEHMEAMGLK